MRKTLPVLVILALLGCNTASDLRRWYVVTDGTTRPARSAAEVQVFETAPTDRLFSVIGIFAPPAEAFQSYAEAVNGARRAAAQHGGDAVIVTKSEEVALRRMNALEASTGIALHAQAIVWRDVR